MNNMKDLIEFIFVISMVFIFFAGIVLAKGFWSTLFAIFFPPWAFYLVVERAMKLLGWI